MSFAIVLGLMIAICWTIGKVRRWWPWAKDRAEALTMATGEKQDDVEYRRGYMFATAFEPDEADRLSRLSVMVDATRKHGRMTSYDRGIEDYLKNQRTLHRIFEDQPE